MGKDTAKYQMTAAQLRGGVRLHSAKKHQVQLRPHISTLLEVDDVLFSTDSAVVMPCPLDDEGKPEVVGDEDTPLSAQGLGLFFVAFHYAKEHANQKLVIAGHTDTTGKPSHNLDLSDARGAAVYAILSGDRDLWAETCDTWHRVDDIQRLLKYYAFRNNSEELDPGPIDNKMGPKTREALEVFQIVYNQERKLIGVADRPELVVDGIMGPKTWGAVFDYYQFDLAQMLGVAPVQTVQRLVGVPPNVPNQSSSEGERPSPELQRLRLDQWREHLNFVDSGRPYIGLGESFPIEKSYKGDYRSDTNRRAAFLFFKPEDKPSLPPERPAQGATYSTEECPFYDAASYSRHPIDPGELFAHHLELQTVDEKGKPVGNVSLVLRPVLGGEVSVQSNGEGYCKVKEELPPGLVQVLLEDKSPAKIRFQGTLLNAVVRTRRSLDSSQVTSVIVEAMAEEERRERETVRRIYGNLPKEESPSSGPAEPEQPPPGEQPSGDGEISFHAHDNLMLVAAAPEDESLAPKRFHDVLTSWLHDYFPQVQERGFALMLLDEKHLRCFGPSGDVKHTFDFVDKDEEGFISPFGAYGPWSLPGGGVVFLDLKEQQYAITQEGWQEVVPIGTFLSEEDTRIFRNDYIGDLKSEILVLYYTPADMGKLGSLAMNGGAGYLEEYTGKEGSELRKHIHRRNLDTLKFVKQVYEGQVQKYQKKVNGIGEGEDLPDDATPEEKQAQAEAQLATLHAMGPPPSIYKFPMPADATKQEKKELNNAGALLLSEDDYDLLSGGYDPLSSEYQAWVAVSEKIDEIYGRHSEGAVFLKADFSLADAAEEVGLDDELTFSVPGVPAELYFKVGYEMTLEVGSDGYFVEGEEKGVSVDYGVRVNAGPASIEANDEGQTTLKVELSAFQLEEELSSPKNDGIDRIVLGPDAANVEITHGEVTGLTVGFLEISEDGTVKLTGKQGTTATYNYKNKEFGYGWDPPLPGVEYLGLHMKGIYEETIRAYLVRAPGFFETRLTYEFYDPTLRWNNLTSRERMSLRALGWNEKTWDRRGEENFTYEEDFPESARKSWFELSSDEKRAAIQLGMDRDDWKKEEWKASASGSESSEE